MSTLRDLLRHHRERRGLSQEELAALVEPTLSPDTISNLERGRTRPYRHTLEALCLALGLDEAERQEVWAAWRARGAANDSASTDGQGAQHGATVRSQPTPLIGREQELQTLQQRLLQPEVRLLTLVGPGGVGKTRMALGLIERVGAHFADGSHFVDLSALRDPQAVVPTIARALGIREESGNPMLQLLIGALRARKLLLVLDNFEHLLDAASMLGDVLGVCSGVSVLATSREPLRLRWEHLHVVPPLRVPESYDLDAVQAAPAVALFVDRAQAVDASFALSDANAPTIATLCSRLDGLPLALELAAARVTALSPEMLLDHLDQQFDLLKGARDAPARHQSLRAALNWSYELLPPHEQALLRALAVFSGGATLDAVQAVCPAAEGSTIAALASLHDKHLVELDTTAGAHLHYRLLDTVRAYAHEQLMAAGEARDVADRHARHYLAVVEQSALASQVARQAWVDRLERDHNNVRGALQFFLNVVDAEAGLRLAISMTWFWSARAFRREGVEWFSRFLELTGSSSLGLLRARALNTAGLLAWEAHDLAYAQAAFSEALASGQALDDAATVASATRGLAQTAAWSGDHAGAQRWYAQSLASSRSHGLDAEAAHALVGLGETALMRCDYVTAAPVLEESLDIFRRLGDRTDAANSLRFLGMLAFGSGDDAAAGAFFQESLELWGVESAGFVADVSLYMGLLALRAGDTREARTRLMESLSIAQREHDAHETAYCLEALACLAATENQPAQASRLYADANAIRRDIGIPRFAYDDEWLAKWLGGVLK